MPDPAGPGIEEKRRALLARRLARHRADVPAAPHRDVVPLAEGAGTPLFLLPAVGGSAGPYVALVEALDIRRPVRGLEAPGLHGGPLTDRLDALAQHYFDLITAAWPEGPYLLAGWSAGGMLAQQVAVRLREQDRPVRLVALFDSVLADPDEPLPDDTELLGQFAWDLAATLGATAPEVSGLRDLPPAHRSEKLFAVLEESGVVPAGIRDELATRAAVFSANARAYLSWRPRPVDVPLTLLPAQDTDPAEAQRWQAYAPSVIRHTVPGNHHTMLHPPALTELAAVLRRCLADADRPS